MPLPSKNMIWGQRCRRLALCACLLIIIVYRHYFRIAVNLILEPLIFTYGDHSFEISAARDDFDVTFSKYPLEPPLRAPNDSNYRIPPIIHHVLLGSMAIKPEWTKAIAACKRYHPGFEFKFWDDVYAASFVEQNYPDIWQTWSGYKYDIQRADSLRYMILDHHGGIFLDLDLHCRRPLDPLRKFSFVAPAAHPAGVSNGFLMSEPKSSFMKKAVEQLKTYDLSWFGLPYLTVSFSTGCHYLSTIHATSGINRTDIRVLKGPNHLHQLNGNVSTPLFHHWGSSSWHSFDAEIIKQATRPKNWSKILQSQLILFAILWIFTVVLFVLLITAAIATGRKKSSHLTSMRAKSKGGDVEEYRLLSKLL